MLHEPLTPIDICYTQIEWMAGTRLKAMKFSDMLKGQRIHRNRAENIYKAAVSAGLLCPYIKKYKDGLELSYVNEDRILTIWIRQDEATSYAYGIQGEAVTVGEFSTKYFPKLAHYILGEQLAAS